MFSWRFLSPLDWNFQMWTPRNVALSVTFFQENTLTWGDFGFFTAPCAMGQAWKSHANGLQMDRWFYWISNWAKQSKVLGKQFATSKPRGKRGVTCGWVLGGCSICISGSVVSFAKQSCDNYECLEITRSGRYLSLNDILPIKRETKLVVSTSPMSPANGKT